MEINVNKINFHPVLKDIENIFWFFLLSIRALSDYEIQDILKIKNSHQEGYECFNSMLNKFNKTTNLKIEIKKTDGATTSKLNILNEMIFMGKAMAVLAYDYLSLSKYNNIISKDDKFKFLKYIRNGAAHNNKFNLKDEDGKWKIGENEIIKWGEKEISRRLQGNKVFNDFISVFDIFLLIKNFSEQLENIDKKASC